jgi:hypothetical protein
VKRAPTIEMSAFRQLWKRQEKTQPVENERFPTCEDNPKEVVAAQLKALRDRSMSRIYPLFSRALRSHFEEAGRAQGGGSALKPPTEFLYKRTENYLEQTCPGLLGNERFEVLSVFELERGKKGRLPMVSCTAVVQAADDSPARMFFFTLTKQRDTPAESDKPPSPFDERNSARFDGFEGCWLIQSITAGGEADGDVNVKNSGGVTPSLGGAAQVKLPVPGGKDNIQQENVKSKPPAKQRQRVRVR